MTTHALTIDLEDWHQLMHRRLTGATIPSTRAGVETTHSVLDMLDEAGVRATFFVVGNVAATYPDLVREVALRGHEIGSHTHSHELIFRMDLPAFKADVERSIGTLQDLTGQPVLGFRAPEFSVGHLGHWCFEVLSGLGLRYDSSVFPLPRARYGILEAPRHPFEIPAPNGTIQEYPLDTWDTGRFRLPTAGGSYFRLLPDRLVRRGLDAIDESGLTACCTSIPTSSTTAGSFPPGRRGGGTSGRQPEVRVLAVLLHNFRTGVVGRRLRPLLARFKFMPLGSIYRTTHEDLTKEHGQSRTTPTSARCRDASSVTCGASTPSTVWSARPSGA